MMGVLFQFLKSDCGRWANGWQSMVKLFILQSLGFIRMIRPAATYGQLDECFSLCIMIINVIFLVLHAYRNYRNVTEVSELL